MNAANQIDLTTPVNSGPIDIRQLQAPLRARYESNAEAALITDRAKTSSTQVPAEQPLYGMLEFSDPSRTQFPIALHSGVGGRSDLPVPGDILCAAIASCLDTTIRVITNFLNIRLKELSVDVQGDADLRGTLKMCKDTPVAFCDIRIHALMVPEGDVASETMDAILTAAEASCVVLQTLRNPPKIQLTHSFTAK